MRSLAELRTDLANYVAAFEADTLLASDAETAVRDAAAIANLASTVQMLAAKRVADSPHWRHRGHRTPAEWLAAQTKSSVGEAFGSLETAEKLADCPGVEAKVRAGELSAPQARALAKAVSVDPAAESRLLGVAETDGLGKLRDECRAVANTGEDADVRHARLHRERSVRHWTDDDGAFRLAAKLTSDAGAKLLGALAPFEQAAFDRARADGRHEPHEAFRADALVDLAEASLSGQSGAKSPCRKPSFTVLVDAAAFLRGDAHPGETCEIPGVGPVPVSLLHEQADAAAWHILATDGVDIRVYCSLTRHIPNSLRVALEARDRECVVPGCNVTTGLEIDHILPLECGGVTAHVNLARLCHHHHHEMKHRRGWILGGGPGAWTFTPPEHPPDG